jgi:DNA polymerase I
MSGLLYGGVTIPGMPDLTNCRKLDLLPISFIRRSHRIGICIDREYTWELGSKFSTEIASLEQDISSYIPPDRLNEFSDATGAIEDEEGSAEFNASSAEQIGTLLFDMLDLRKMAEQAGLKLQETKTKGRLTTGKKQLEILQKLQHPVVPLVLRHRELKKLVSTYCVAMPKRARLHPRSACCPVCELAHSTDQWRIHGEMGTTRASTGRINHKNPNLGNLPVRTPDGQAVLAGFIAPPGHKLVTRDLSQIELRTLAHLSVTNSMIQIYLDNGDIHDKTARTIFDLPADVKPDKAKHRLPSKRVSFSIANGTTDKGLYLQLVMDYGSSKIPVPDWLTEDWCQWLLTQWLEAYPEVQTHFERQWYRARRYGMVWDLFGRVKLIPEVKSYHSWIRQSGLRQAQNMSMTSTAAGQLKLIMGKTDDTLQRAYDAGVWCWPLLTIHDAVMVEVEEEHAEGVDELLAEDFDNCMRDVETGEEMFRVPIRSDGDVIDYDETGLSRWKK